MIRLCVFKQSMWNNVNARATDYFIHAIAKQCDCKLCGPGFPDHVPGEGNSLAGADKTFKRLYPDGGPDWTLSLCFRPKSIGVDARNIQIGADIHVDPKEQARWHNVSADYSLLRVVRTARGFDTYADFEGCWGLPTERMLLDPRCKEVGDDFFTKHLKVPWSLLIHSAEPTVFHPREVPIFDVSLIGAVGIFYPIRLDAWRTLPALAQRKNWKILLPPHPPSEGVLDSTKIEGDSKYYIHDRYAETLARSKVFIFDSSIFKYPLLKYVEGLMSGTLVMADMPLEGDRLHLKDGWNFVEISLANWREKLEYYLVDDQLRETIARRGYETALQYHTNEVRAREFISLLEDFDRKEAAP